MFFPFSLSDVSLLLAVLAAILLATSELLYSLPDFASRIPVDKGMLRLIALGCGLSFAATVVMRILGYI